MRHQDILVIGGSGFVGGHLVAALAGDGRRVTVPARRRESAKRLLLLPTVDVVEADVNDDDTLARLVAGRDAVINLVGILHGDRGTPYGRAFEAAHVTLPKRIVAACRASRVERLLHMSALGAASDGPSMYLRSKAAGESVVEATGIDRGDGRPIATTIFRPSVIFGPDDRFMNLFATMQRWLPVVPLARADARFQPVSVHDVAAAFCATIDDSESFSRIYELTGPRVYTLAELVRIAGIYRAGGNGRPRPVLALPDALGRLQATFLEFAPGPTMMSRDNFDSMRTPNVGTGGFPGLADLGIVATPLAQEASRYLGRKNRRTHFDHLRHDAHP
jgi:NADH dehydrogenase